MKNKVMKNVGVSVRDRLLRIARERGEDYQLLLTRYALERLLYRLSGSQYRDQFILKGAMLFTLWGRDTYRPTRDVDFLVFGENDAAGLIRVFRGLCELKVDDDGVIFVPESVQAEPIRDETAYGGIRIRLEARLAEARIPIQADIGFGDAITPSPERIIYPTLLKSPAPKLRAYPRESVVSEKLEAMVSLGMANSRMKDFYDLRLLATRLDFDGPRLSRAIEATFERRRTPLPKEVPTAMTREFGEDRQKSAQWSAFLRRGSIADSGQDLVGICIFLHDFLWPPLRHLEERETFQFLWPASGPWLQKKRGKERK
ncbi:MAG: nucleotidyl transferase AbiEii/AbiGii toxin family protein [Candidatus Eisenbacteria bacterium]|nr:nucleotidyl transferase AbiEii/AbiGii toxin family protein [Candidatus Eisenbacteria bacterium]